MNYNFRTVVDVQLVDPGIMDNFFGEVELGIKHEKIILFKCLLFTFQFQRVGKVKMTKRSAGISLRSYKHPN